MSDAAEHSETRVVAEGFGLDDELGARVVVVKRVEPGPNQLIL
jgi:hypothetical protein